MNHHIYGPSSMGRRFSCPGSAREESGLPERTSVAAEEGTEFHAQVASLLRLEEVKDCDELAYKCYQRVPDFDVKEKWIEETITFQIGRHTVSGTPDLVLVLEDRAIVFDWKFGRHLYEKDLTFQLSAYAVGVGKHYKVPVTAYAYWPRLDTEREVVVDDLAASETDLAGVIDACEKPDAPLVTGDHCNFCRALGICSATRAAVEDLAMTVPTGPTMAERGRAVADQIKRWPADRVLELDGAVQLAKMVVKAHEARVRECLDFDPECFSGAITLTESAGTRTADPRKLFESINDNAWTLTPEEFLEHGKVKVSVKALEDEFVRQFTNGDKPGLYKTKVAAREAFQAATKDVVSQATVKKLKRKKS